MLPFIHLNKLYILNKRCTGHCCKAFILPMGSPEDLQRKKAQILNRKDHTIYEGEPDILQSIDMVIYLGHDPQKLSLEQQKVIPILNFDADPETSDCSHYYTCKHHDPITGDCRIYRTRPYMCQQFPQSYDTKWDGSCSFRGCTRRYSIFVIIANYYKKWTKPLREKLHYDYYYKLLDILFFLRHGRKRQFEDMVDLSASSKKENHEKLQS